MGDWDGEIGLFLVPSFGSAPAEHPPVPAARSERRRAQGRSRMARSATVRLVLDGREHGGTMAANVARRGPMRDIDLFQLALGLVPPPSSTSTRSGSISRSTSRPAGALPVPGAARPTARWT